MIEEQITHYLSNQRVLDLFGVDFRNDNINDYRAAFYQEINGEVVEIVIKHLDLQSLPEEIGSLSNLSYLKIIDCGLESLPYSISEMESLRMIYLRDNKLRDVNLNELNSLQYLLLSGNDLVSFPLIRDCDQLEKLFVGFNEITSIPEWLLEMDSLKILCVKGNPIKDLAMIQELRDKGVETYY